ncbi:MAG: hypothetical protein R3A13_02015 [Bdellovibrionota bacterium]
MKNTGSSEQISPNGFDSEFRDKAEAVKEDVKDLGRYAYDAATQKAEELKRSGKEKFSELSEAGKDKLCEMKKAGSIRAQQIEDYIVEHPIKSMVYAVGAGLVLSKIFGSSKNN